MDRFILNSVRNYFIEKDHNAPALASMPDAVAGTKRAQTLDEFMQAAVPFAGCSSMGCINSVRFKCSSFIFWTSAELKMLKYQTETMYQKSILLEPFPSSRVIWMWNYENRIEKPDRNLGAIFQGEQPDGVCARKRDSNPSAKRSRRLPLC